MTISFIFLTVFQLLNERKELLRTKESEKVLIPRFTSINVEKYFRYPIQMTDKVNTTTTLTKLSGN